MLETGTDEEAEERQLERDRETHRYHTQDMLIARIAISKEFRDIGPVCFVKGTVQRQVSGVESGTN